MAITRLGSISDVHSSQNSGSTTVTVPSGTTLAVMGFHGYASSDIIASAAHTLGGLSMTRGPYVGANSEDWSGIFYIASNSIPSGSQTFAWNWGGSSNWSDGSQMMIAYYSGVLVSDPLRDSDTASVFNTSSTATLSTPTLTAQTGDLLFAALYCWDNTTMPSSITWTGAASLHGEVYNGSFGAIADGAPTDNVVVTVDPVGNSGNYLWLALSAAIFKPDTGGAPGNPWYYYAQQMRQKLEEKLKRRILIPGFAGCMRYGFAR